MTKRVQILGHDFETANAFIGFEREVTVDTDNWELRLHDGSTPGGWIIYNLDQNDARYQARSVELDGLLGWEPNERGLVTRLGPANYQLREIIVDPDNLTVVDGDGHDGNPTIALNPVIASDHTATGNWEFTQPITATGGIFGDIIGDTVGTHIGPTIGLHTGDVIGDVTGDVTGNLTGGFDTRGATIIMDNAQIDPAWIDGLGDIVAGSGIMIGGIIAFSGVIGDIPANWALCDGTNGTPDLRDRFIVGAGVTFAADSSGGAVSHAHSLTITAGGAHTHTGSADSHALSVAELPAHKHATGVCDNSNSDVFNRGSTAAFGGGSPNSIESNGADGVFEGYSETVGDGAGHTHALTVDSGGDHAHVGSTSAGNSVPPYYALMYIMRAS